MKPTYRALDGAELKAALLKRVESGIERCLDTRAFRSYPLVRWSIMIEVTPYEHAGADVIDGEIVPRQPIESPTDTMQFGGYDFVKCEFDGVRASETSPIVGIDVDPQDIREQAGLGKLVSKLEEGQHVDSYAKPLEPPKPTPEGTVPVVIGQERASAAKLVTDEEAERIAREEENSWSSPHEDPDFHRAVRSGDPVPGRVTVVGTGAEKPRKRGRN